MHNTTDSLLPWFTYSIMVIGWYLFAIVAMADGYWHEMTGHKLHEHHKHTHRLMWQFHTGLHIDPKRSHGDERRLKKTSAAVSRATPEGQQVYWTRLPRWAKAVRNNGIVFGTFAVLNGMIWAPGPTIAWVTVALTLAIAVFVVRVVRRLRRWAAQRPVREVKQPVLAKTKAALGVAPPQPTLHIAGGTVVEEKPSLSGGVPHKVMCLLLAAPLSVSTDEADTLLTLNSQKGVLRLPDRFPALQTQRDTVEEIVRAQSGTTLRFTWHTSQTPRYVEWIPVLDKLPPSVAFRDYLTQLGQLERDTFGVGLTVQRGLYVQSHTGDTPWWATCMNSGTGKSTRFQIKVAQICHQDPTAEVYCWDSKQISFAAMRGLPNVYVFDDPVNDIHAMWNSWYDVEKIMRDRYQAVREGRARKEEFSKIWCLMDEGNDFYSQMKNLWEREKQKGESACPAVFSGPITSILYQGREVGIRGEMMFQNLTDRALGNCSLRDAFPGVGMAGYKKNQWARIIGSQFVEPRVGPGKICMCLGTDEEWVQGFYDDSSFLRAYALNGREDPNLREGVA